MKRLFIAFSLLITLLCISTETEAQTQRTRTYLHGRFETGDYPTQTDYRDVFATFFSRLEDSLSISVLYGVDTISNDVTLADSSTVALVTEAAVKGYVDAAAGSVTNGDKGDITVASGTWTIDNDAVDAAAIATGAVGTSEIANNSVANADLATMATNTLKGNDDGGTATPQDLTIAEVKTMLSITSTDVTDFEEAVEDLVGANIVAGSGATVSYDDGTGNTTITVAGLADGDKGDIDVTGSGTTWSIDTSSVTTLAILDETISASDIDTGAVTTSEILNATIAYEDLSPAVQDSISAPNLTVAGDQYEVGLHDGSGNITASDYVSYNTSTNKMVIGNPSDGQTVLHVGRYSGATLLTDRGFFFDTRGGFLAKMIDGTSFRINSGSTLGSGFVMSADRNFWSTDFDVTPAATETGTFSLSHLHMTGTVDMTNAPLSNFNGIRIQHTYSTGSNYRGVYIQTNVSGGHGIYQSGSSMVNNFAGKMAVGTTTSPTVTFEAVGTDAIVVPVGTTAQRPGSPANGMIRFNTTTSKYEGYVSGIGWVDFH